MNYGWKIIAIMVLLQGYCGMSFAANHYVRSDATGSGSGADWTNAYRILPNTLIRGDVYYVADGVYPATLFNTPASGTQFITVKKAIPADHGTDTGWNSSMGDGQSLFAGMLEFTTSYWIFDGQTGGGVSENWTRNFGFRVEEKRDAYALIRINYTGNASHISLRHLDMVGKGSVSTVGGYYSNDGVALYNNPQDITLSYAWLHETGRCPVFIISSQNVIFEHVYVSSFYGSPEVHSEVMSAGQGPLGDITWRYSLITAMRSTGGLIFNNIEQPSSHLYVYGNVFYHPPGVLWDIANGVIGGWTSTSNAMNNVWVYNNTFVNIDQDSLSVLPILYSGNRAYNNLFVNSRSPNFSRFPDHDANYFINSGDNHGELTGIAVTGGDPFMDLTNLDFRLKAGNSNGQKLDAPYNTDALGNIRGADGVWDRGAFEYTAIQPLQPPKNLRVK